MLLALKQVTKIFNEGTIDEKVALQSINLTLAPGDFVTIIGSNGAGKSTMMNIISDGSSLTLVLSGSTEKTSRRFGNMSGLAISAACFRTRLLAQLRI